MTDSEIINDDLICVQVVEKIDMMINAHILKNSQLEDQQKIIRQKDEYIISQDILINEQKTTIDNMSTSQATYHSILIEYSQVVDQLVNTLLERGMDISDIQHMFDPNLFPGIYSRRHITSNSSAV
jgi:hypothetical protein